MEGIVVNINRKKNEQELKRLRELYNNIALCIYLTDTEEDPVIYNRLADLSNRLFRRIQIKEEK